MNLKVKLLHPTAKVPQCALESAGYDLFAIKEQALVPSVPTLIELGIATEFDSDFGAFIWDRSSFGAKGIHRLAGLIDYNYRNEWKVVLINLTKDVIMVNPGEKVAQVVFQRIKKPIITVVEELSDSNRMGGFGSTNH